MQVKHTKESTAEYSMLLIAKEKNEAFHTILVIDLHINQLLREKKIQNIMGTILLKSNISRTRNELGIH